MPRLKKGSPAAKAWGRRMRALRGRKVGRRKGRKAAALPYEPLKARKRRAAPKRRVTKGRRKALPFGYGAY